MVGTQGNRKIFELTGWKYDPFRTCNTNRHIVRWRQSFTFHIIWPRVIPYFYSDPNDQNESSFTFLVVTFITLHFSPWKVVSSWGHVEAALTGVAKIGIWPLKSTFYCCHFTEYSLILNTWTKAAIVEWGHSMLWPVKDLNKLIILTLFTILQPQAVKPQSLVSLCSSYADLSPVNAVFTRYA